MRNGPLFICLFLWMWANPLLANDKWFGLPFDPFAGLDDCSKALVQRLVMDQKFSLGHRDFHRVQNSFDQLGIVFDKAEHEDIPLRIDPMLVSYEALSVHRVFRGDVVTEYYSVETRIGAPGILAERVNAKAFWHKDELGFLGVLEGPRANSAQTRGAAELQRLWLEQRGSGPALLEEIRVLDFIGKLTQNAVAEEAFKFYEKNLVRRSWSEKTKKRLKPEFLESLRHSVLSISRLVSTGDIVGIFQTIRAPYGRRIVAREQGANLEIVSDEVGAWGDSVRKYGIKNANVFYLTDQELYDRMNANRNANGELPMIRPPVENKLREQGICIARNCLMDTEEQILIDGVPHLVFWGSGEIDEPARLAVDRSQNPHLFVEILTQLLTSAVDPHFSMDYNTNNRSYYTYNDLPALYYCANFRRTGACLTIDGAQWPVLKTDGAGHIHALTTMKRDLEKGDERRLEEIKSAVIRYMDGAH